MTSSSFGLLFSYSATWSDRYAVHPCKVNLYDVTGSRGKFEPASKWWKPEGKGVGATESRTNHADELQVMAAPGTAIQTACTMDTCPWPKQLYLKEAMSLEAQFANDWNLQKFPFDTQTLTGNIRLVTNFARASDQVATELNITGLDTLNATRAYLRRLYPLTAWSVISVRLQQPSTVSQPFDVSFEVTMRRNAAGAVFKVIIPLMSLMMLTVLAANMQAAPRLKVIGLCLIASANMLNPRFLGLPEGYDGPMPFLMAIVVVHMAVAGCLLLFTLLQEEGNFVLDLRLEKMRRVYAKEAKKEFRETAAVRDTLFTEVFGSTPGVLRTSSLQPIDPQKKVPLPSSKGGAAQIEPTVQMSEVNLSSEPVGTGRLEKIMCLIPALIHYTIHGNERAPLNPFNPKLEYVDQAAREHKKRERWRNVILHYSVGPAYFVGLAGVILGYFVT